MQRRHYKSSIRQTGKSGASIKGATFGNQHHCNDTTNNNFTSPSITTTTLQHSKPIVIRKSQNTEWCCHHQQSQQLMPSPSNADDSEDSTSLMEEEEDPSSVLECTATSTSSITTTTSITSSILSSQVVSSCSTTINPFASFALLPPIKNSPSQSILPETTTTTDKPQPLNILAFNPILNSIQDEHELLKTFKKAQSSPQSLISTIFNSFIMETLSEYPTDGTFDFGWTNPNTTVPNSPVASPSTSPLELASPSNNNNSLLRFALTSNLPSAMQSDETNPKPLSTKLVQTLVRHQEEANSGPFPILDPNAVPDEPFFTSFETMNDLLKEHERGDLESFLLALPPVKKCLCDRKALHCCVCGHVGYGTAKDLYLPNLSTGITQSRRLLLPSLSSTLKGKKLIAEKKKDLMMDVYRKSQSSMMNARFPIFLSISHPGHLQPPSTPAPKLTIPGTFCCGMTYEIFVKVFIAKHSQYKQFSSIEQMMDIKRDWFCEKEDEDDETYKQGCYKALMTRNLGIHVESISDAIKGDFIQFWRHNGTGHSVIFNSLSEDGTEFEYWSSQRSTKGLGFNKENVSSITNFYIVRLKDEPAV